MATVSRLILVHWWALCCRSQQWCIIITFSSSPLASSPWEQMSSYLIVTAHFTGDEPLMISGFIIESLILEQRWAHISSSLLDSLEMRSRSFLVERAGNTFRPICKDSETPDCEKHMLNCKINGTVHIFFFLKSIAQPPVNETAPIFFSRGVFP